MDGSRFDSLVSSLSDASSRRQVLRLLGTSAAGGLAAMAGLSMADAKKKKRRKKKRRKKNSELQCKRAGAFCETNRECCPDRTRRICAVASNAGNSDKTCCGGTGAVCGAPNEDGDNTAPFCCAGFDCTLNSGTGGYTCQPVPDDL